MLARSDHREQERTRAGNGDFHEVDNGAPMANSRAPRGNVLGDGRILPFNTGATFVNTLRV